MRHLDLFSGIGGFAYAADQVFGDVEHIFCDNDPFCRQILKKHWPEAYIYDDIRSITANANLSRHFYRQSKEQSAERHDKALGKPKPGVRPPAIQFDVTNATLRGQRQGKPEGYRQRQQEKATGSQRRGVDLLTGGFPCQPFSAAGLRRGTADERHLWPEMLRVIKLTQPQWVIAENVRGILTWNEGLVFEQVCADLETAGYSVWPLIIPAVAVNAPHRRDRVWFVAHRPDKGLEKREQSRQTSSQKKNRTRLEHRITDNDTDATNSPSDRRFGRGPATEIEKRYTKEPRLRGQLPGRFEGQDSWNQNWLEVAAELCGVDDGLPAELDGFELTKPQHRQERLKSLGNAIVPQVAIEIMKGMI